MPLPLVNLKASEIKAGLGVSDSDIENLCYNDAINMWSLRKPANYNTDALSGEQPRGQANYVSGYRLGDFRGYNHQAHLPLSFDESEYYVFNYIDVIPKESNIFIPVILSNNGEIPPSLINDGYDPVYLFDQGLERRMRVRAELWLNDSIVAAGDWVEAGDPGWGNKVLLEGDPGIETIGVPPGDYTLRGRQQWLNGAWAGDDFFINGGDSSLILEGSQAFDISGEMIRYPNSIAVFFSIIDNAWGAQYPLNITITIEKVNPASSLFIPSPTATLRNQSATNSGSVNFPIWGSGRAKLTIQNVDTNYQYFQYIES